MIRKICFRSRGTMQPISPFLVALRHGAFINQISSQRSAPLLPATTTINSLMSILWKDVIVNDVISQRHSLLALQKRAVWRAPSSPLQSVNLQLLISTCGISLAHPRLRQTQIKEMTITQIRMIIVMMKRSKTAASSRTQVTIVMK